jgi:hypothetical protein
MKKNLLLLFICIMMINSGCTGNQKSQTEESGTISAVQANLLTEEDAIIQMLIEFYTVYNKTWIEADVSILKEQLDSLRRKYCTQRFIEEMFDEYLDYDVLMDFGMEDLESLKVTKDNSRENTYWVTYIGVSETPWGEKSYYDIKIHLVVVKENGVFKIDEVLNPFKGVSLRK